MTNRKVGPHRKVAAMLVVLLAIPCLLQLSSPAIATSDPQRSAATRQGRVNVKDLARFEDAFPPSHEKERGEDAERTLGERRVPGNLSVSAEDQARARASATQAPGEPASPAPALPTRTASFPALDDNNTAIPPDTSGSVGPNHLMIAHNSEVRIQNRSGGQVTRVSLGGFWNSLGAPATFDPKVEYDPYGGRWIITTAADENLATSSLLIGASETNDPTGSWNLYRIDADSANRVWADRPNLGFNKNWAVVQVNLFPIGGSTFSGSQIYAFDKAGIYAGAAPSFTRFPLGPSLGSGQVPTLTLDPALSTMYLIQRFSGNSGGNGFLRIMTITGAVGSETLNTSGPLVSGPPWADFQPGFTDFGPQQGTPTKISLEDDRIQNVVYRNGTLWTTHTVFLPQSSPTHSAIQWWQIRPDGSVRQRGLLENTSGPTFYGFPSIAVNSSDDALIGYSRFSSTQFASANYAFRAHTDPLNTLQADTVLKAGEASYVKTFGGPSNRFGDFSNTVVDPTNDNEFWTIQEYASTSRPEGGVPFDRWGTWWGQLAPPTTLPIVRLSSPTYVTPESGSATIVVNRTNNPAGAVTIHYATGGGTATAGSDYTATAGTLALANGVTSGSFVIPIAPDTSPEQEETVNITLSAPSGAVLGSPATGVLTIKDDDPVLQFSSATYTVYEGGPGGGSPPAVITVSRTGGSSLTVGASYATANGTAIAGSDYTSTAGTLSFGAGVAGLTFSVPITNDAFIEDDETLSLSLAPVAPAAFPPDSAPLTISDQNDRNYMPRFRRPDGIISGLGNNIYNTTGAHQTIARNIRLRLGHRRRFSVGIRAQNDGNVSDVLHLRASGFRRSRGIRVRYSSGGRNITHAIRAGTFSTGPLPPGAIRSIRIEITFDRGARIRRSRNFTIRILTRSTAVPALRDMVRFTVRVRRR